MSPTRARQADLLKGRQLPTVVVIASYLDRMEMLCSFLYIVLLSDVSHTYGALFSDTTSCPPWSQYNEYSSKCECPYFLHCDNSGYADGNCFCATYDGFSNFSEVGYCTFGCNTNSFYNFHSRDKLLWNKALCGPYGRTGTLCGSCQSGLFQPVYSYDLKCVECSNQDKNFWLYILLAFVPLTVFYFILLHLQINLVTSPIFGFVLYSQMLANPFFIRALLTSPIGNLYVDYYIRIMSAVFGVWNLDFFRGFNKTVCFEIGSLPALLLDFIVALYPLLLMVLTYLIIYLYNCNCTPVRLARKTLAAFSSYFRSTRITGKRYTGTSIINSFAAYILLSNVKLLSTCVDILTPVTVYHFTTPDNVSQVTRLYYDATITYFGYSHFPYAVLAIAILSVLVVLPTVLLVLYPFRWFQRLKNLLPSRCVLFLNTFVDCFQGCYKDGSKPRGSLDYRCLAAIPFILRLSGFFVNSINSKSSLIPPACIILVLSAILLITVDPLQEQYETTSYSWVLYTLLLACLVAALSGIQVALNFYNFAYIICFIVIAVVMNFISLLGFLQITLLYANRYIGCKWFTKSTVTEQE